MKTQQTFNFSPQIIRTAIFSRCKKYRYILGRSWDADKPSLLCVLLNPSTADAYRDDPTNKKVMKWAIKNGFGVLTFCNLFAFRSPYPDVMKKAAEPIGPVNDRQIKLQIKLHDVVVAGWGNNGTHLDRDRTVLTFYSGWKCFKVNTAKGTPMHPLYMRDDSQLRDYPVESEWRKDRR